MLHLLKIKQCLINEFTLILDNVGSDPCLFTIVVYYESIKRELNRRLIYECRCDERLKEEAERSTRLGYTGLCGELEHLKIETR